ncbi:MAG: hypothetical protein IPJ03_17775 [Ignavibacteriales bacterium]|nr:hypothetical protein [Ignavibacteriales bacterium]
MIVEHTGGEYLLRGSFKFNQNGLMVVVSSRIENVTDKHYTEGKGAEITSNAINLTDDEAKQLANFIVAY